MWIDTHCHLDAREFDADRDAVVAQAHAAGVNHIVVPAVARWNFDTVRTLAHRHAGCSYALGIHPMCAAQASDDDLAELRRQVAASMDDPR
ncbi:TatD family hydrolase, partial [Pandoraea nosoerga]|nr:TatD family hydrolase [Pandoraea nosoerga]